MLLFVLFVAVVNLAVGYALGAGLNLSSLMQLLPQRDEKPVIADIDDAAPLSRAAPITESTQAPNAEKETMAPEEKPETTKSPAVDVMASLREFRQKLNNANVELKLHKQDPEKFSENATKLQEANHEYLEEAGEAIKQLEELGAAGDEVASATREAVSTGATEVAAISSEIDELIESGLDSEEAREKLVAKSETLSEVAVEAEKVAVEIAATVEASQPEPEASEEQAALVTPDSTTDEIDRLFDHLESLLAEAQDDAVSHVAVVRIDAPAEAEANDALTSALEETISELAKELLAEGQTFVPGRPALMLLEGDTYEQALERVEQLRQQVEATTFSFGEQEVRATVTCAFADARKDHNRDQIMRHLDEALGESSRVGGNKTFHHDGAFPTETPQAKVTVEPRTMALALAV
jgi:ElaB/YqjD/DUF883 family membrane-anchored ribosome-binding protein